MERQYCELTAFLHYWLHYRTLLVPNDMPMDFADKLAGVVLFREDQYQVQLFTLQPNTVIHAHCHPNVDSYEVHIGGDLTFEVDGFVHSNRAMLDHIRIFPHSKHTAISGPRGGCFVSVQKWLNGVKPTTVGHDWDDANGNQIGTASQLIDVPEEIKKGKIFPSDVYMHPDGGF